MTIHECGDLGVTWELDQVVDVGSTAYSSLVEVGEKTGILYERSSCSKKECPLVFIPEKISSWLFKGIGDLLV